MFELDVNFLKLEVWATFGLNILRNAFTFLYLNIYFHDLLEVSLDQRKGTFEDVLTMFYI